MVMDLKLQTDTWNMSDTFTTYKAKCMLLYLHCYSYTYRQHELNYE